MNKRVDKLEVDFPSCEGIVTVDHDFPKIQLDRKLGAELVPGEVVDLSEERIKKYLEYAEIPEQCWGDLSLIITGAENSSYLGSDELGYVSDDGEGGLDVVIGIDYDSDSEATLRHELCHVKDAIDGEIDFQKKNLLYTLGSSISKERLRKQAIIIHALGALAYACGMYFNSEEMKNSVLSAVVANNTVAAALLGAHLKGYYHDPGEKRARKAAEHGKWLPHVFTRRIDTIPVDELASSFASHPWTSVYIAKNDDEVRAREQAAGQLGLSYYATTDPEEVELLAVKGVEREYVEYKRLVEQGVISKRGLRKFKISEIVDDFMDRAEVATKGGGAMVAVLPDSMHRVNMGEYSKRYDDIKCDITE